VIFGDGFERPRLARGEVSSMTSRSVGRVHLLSTIIALAALNTFSQRIALAQIPEAPGTNQRRDGTTERAAEAGTQRKVTPKPNEAAPDSPRDTIDEMERARERASGTPEPEPTPKWD
jgi:hypothetical protein